MTPAERVAAAKAKRGRAGTFDSPLRRLRTDLDLSLRDAAVKIGISHAALGYIEGGILPKLNVARAIARFYGKTLDDIWPESNGVR